MADVLAVMLGLVALLLAAAAFRDAGARRRLAANLRPPPCEGGALPFTEVRDRDELEVLELLERAEGVYRRLSLHGRGRGEDDPERPPARPRGRRERGQ